MRRSRARLRLARWLARRRCASSARPAGGAFVVKELCESIEAFAVIEAYISAMDRRGRKINLIADVACGHGHVGILLAYRFPHVSVICCDRVRRESFDAMLEAFRSGGAKLPSCTEPLQNVSFVEGCSPRACPAVP